MIRLMMRLHNCIGALSQVRRYACTQTNSVVWGHEVEAIKSEQAACDHTALGRAVDNVVAVALPSLDNQLWLMHSHGSARTDSLQQGRATTEQAATEILGLKLIDPRATIHAPSKSIHRAAPVRALPSQSRNNRAVRPDSHHTSLRHSAQNAPATCDTQKF